MAGMSDSGCPVSPVYNALEREGGTSDSVCCGNPAAVCPWNAANEL